MESSRLLRHRHVARRVCIRRYIRVHEVKRDDPHFHPHRLFFFPLRVLCSWIVVLFLSMHAMCLWIYVHGCECR